MESIKRKIRKNIRKDQTLKKNNKKRVEKKKSTYPSEDEDVFNFTWDEKEERTKTSTTRKMYERSEDKISESKIDKTTDKEKEFFGKRIVNFLKKCYNRCKNFITKIRKITNKMEMIGDLLEDEDIIDAVKRIKRYGVNGVKLLLPQKLNAKIIFGFEDPYYTGKVLGWTAALIPIVLSYASLYSEWICAVNVTHSLLRILFNVLDFVWFNLHRYPINVISSSQHVIALRPGMIIPATKMSTLPSV